MDAPFVSIIVITYNQEHCLAKTLDAILAQHCTFEYEVIVSDDCSKDKTRDVITSYCQRYECIVPIFNEANLGLVDNYIHAISKTRGKYIAMCDGDDVWIDSQKLQKQIDVMETDPEVGLVYTDVVIDSVVTNEKYIRRCADPKDDVFSQLLVGNFITVSTACFRASLLKYVDFDAFRSNGFIMQDYPMWLSMCHYTRFHHIPEPMVSYLIDHKVVNSSEVSLHACRFDENTTKIRSYYLQRFPNATQMTESEIWDAHYRIGYRSGINTKDRKRALEYVEKITDKSKYEQRLRIICRSNVLFHMYLVYRRKCLKPKSQLDLYFGN